MSRVANNPVVLPSGVEVKLNGQDINVKGSKGALDFTIHRAVEVTQEEKSCGLLPVMVPNSPALLLAQPVHWLTTWSPVCLPGSSAGST